MTRTLSPLAQTGDPTLDAALTELDRQLLGGVGRRLETVLEIKDHLLERQASLVEAGVPAGEAAHRVVDSFGDVAVIARAQRHAVLWHAARTALLFGLLLAVEGVLSARSPLRVVVTSVIAGGLFGGFFVFWSPPTDLAMRSARPLATAFVVDRKRATQIGHVVALLVFLGAAGVSLANGLPHAVVGVMALIAAFQVARDLMTPGPLRVDALGLDAGRGLMPWTTLRGVERTARGTRLSFDAGRIRVPSDMRNAARLTAAAYSQLARPGR